MQRSLSEQPAATVTAPVVLPLDPAPDVQDVFLAAMKGLGRFRGRSDVSTWLTSIAVNACRSHWRKRAIRLRFLTDMVGRGSRDGSAGPDEGVMDRESFARVRRAVQSLPQKLREVVVLRYLEELSRDDVAVAVCITRDAVDVRLHRARKYLKGTLADLIED